MSFPSRREFLGNAAAVGAVSLLPGRLLADEGTGSKPGPNSRLRVAVLGVNGQGRAHLRWLLDEADAEIAAICDADLGDKVVGPAVKMVEKARGKAPAVVQDLRKVLDDKTIDAVTIATPNHWHSLAAIWAVQAGKDVYVEKPVSHNLVEGRRLVEFARKHGRVVQTGTQSRSMGAMRDVVAFLRAGKLGKVNVARALTYKKRNGIGRPEGGVGAVPATADYDLWCGPGPKEPLRRASFHYDWHWFWDYGGGDMANSGIHQMDICRWALGKDGLPSSVVSFGGRYAWDDNGETPNEQVTFLDYGDCLLVNEVRNLASSDYLGAGIGIVFHGTGGRLVCQGNARAVATGPEGKVLAEFKGDGSHMRNFLDAVKARKPGMLHAEILEGHLSTALCHLGNISWRTGTDQVYDPAAKPLGSRDEVLESFDRMKAHLAEEGTDLAKEKIRIGRPLTFDPAAEKFTGEGAGAANALLGREYRAPYVLPDKA